MSILKQGIRSRVDTVLSGLQMLLSLGPCLEDAPRSCSPVRLVSQVVGGKDDPSPQTDSSWNSVSCCPGLPAGAATYGNFTLCAAGSLPPCCGWCATLHQGQASVWVQEMPWAHHMQGLHLTTSASSMMSLCNPLDCSPPGSSVHGILQARILEGVALLQAIFPTQGLNPGLPHCRRILYHLSRQGSPMSWDLSQMLVSCLQVKKCFCHTSLLEIAWCPHDQLSDGR